MIELLVSLAGLLMGPAFFRIARYREWLYAFLDGFVLVGVAGLILSEVLPRTIDEAGPSAIAWAVAGFALPFFLERRFSLLPFSPNAFFRWIMILGLLLHQTLDGVALSKPFRGQGIGSLQLAVILHQVPKGFFIWGMVGAAMGQRMAGVVIGALCLATAIGFSLGGNLAAFLASHPLWLFQAFIGGGLLHVIVHHAPGVVAPAGCSSDAARAPGRDLRPGPIASPSRRSTFFAGVGALLSLLGLLALAYWGELDSPEAPGGGFGSIFVRLTVESAPWILLGFAAAGAFQALLPRFIFAWFFRGQGRMTQALRGIALGLPLPLCSCGVVPVYLSLLRKSVPPAAALAFLIATPEIGIDSFFFSWKLLGMEITIIRLAMAFIIALLVALTLARTFEKIERAGELDRLTVPEDRPLPATLGGRLLETLRVAALEIVDHTGAWILVGIAVAALVEPYVDQEWFARVPPGVDVLLLSLIGLPLYVCASAATPLAGVLLHKGVSTGAVLAFLITGPATNVTTFGILRRYHGMKGAALFAICVYVFSIATGFGINWLFPTLPGAISPIEELLLKDSHGPVAVVSSLVLFVLIAGTILRLGPRGFLSTVSETLAGPPGMPRSHSDQHEHGPHEKHGRGREGFTAEDAETAEDRRVAP